MTAQKMNLINALTLILLGLWGYIDVSNYKLVISYNVLDRLINVIYRSKGTILDKVFTDKVIVHISLPTKAEKIIREEFKMINMSLIN